MKIISCVITTCTRLISLQTCDTIKLNICAHLSISLSVLHDILYNVNKGRAQMVMKQYTFMEKIDSKYKGVKTWEAGMIFLRK